MNQLGDRNYALLEDAIKTTGSYDPSVTLGLCEERLYVDEIDEITAFMQWVHDNKLHFGSGNYEQRFAEFKASQGTKKAVGSGLKNKDVAHIIGGAVKVVAKGLIGSGKIGKVIRPAFHHNTDEFLGWKVEIGNKEWIFKASDLHSNLVQDKLEE